MKIWPWVIGYLIALAFIVMVGVNKSKADELLTKEVIDPSVQVLIQGAGKDEAASCSGTVVESTDLGTVILLAKHCFGFKKIQQIVVITEDSSTIQYDTHEYAAQLVATSNVSDLAIIMLEDLTVQLPVAKMGEFDKVMYGDKVWNASHPKAFPLILNEGYMASLITAPIFQDVSSTGRFYLSSMQIAEGSSGSGLFLYNGKDYVLVGVCTGITEILPWVSFWTPVDEIIKFRELNPSEVTIYKENVIKVFNGSQAN